MEGNLIDPDAIVTWPDVVREWAIDRAERWHDIDNTTDLDPHDEDDHFRSMLTEPVRAFHCTRLLPHEVKAIRDNGLRVLSEQLAVGRIDAALDFRCITRAERDLLFNATMFAQNPKDQRAGRLFGFISDQPLRFAPSLNYFLSEWGGEVVRMTAASRTLPDRLVRLGSPAIVVFRIRLDVNWRRVAVSPGVCNVFVSTVRGFTDNGASLRIADAIGPEAIDAIWQPGCADYDGFGGLVRS